MVLELCDLSGDNFISASMCGMIISFAWWAHKLAGSHTGLVTGTGVTGIYLGRGLFNRVADRLVQVLTDEGISTDAMYLPSTST